MQFAMLFPGQGSQSLGMLAEISAQFPLIQDTFQQASDVLGYDLWALAQSGPEQKLNQTEFTQPALLAADVALFRCWQAQHGAQPSVLAGHSLGEYAALVCADALAFVDAVDLVAKRGRYMQEAVTEGEGAMAAIIGLEDEVVSEICEQAAQGDVLTPANFNSVGQIVIAGNTDAVNRAIELAQGKEARMAILIPVSVPSHCALMAPAAERLAVDLNASNIQTPAIPVVQNFDVTAHSEPEAIRQALINQLTQPVRWVETIRQMHANDINTMVECGPGRVLLGLNKRITRDIKTSVLNTPEQFQQTLEALGGKANVA